MYGSVTGVTRPDASSRFHSAFTVKQRPTIPSVNRWLLAALGVALAGAAVAFFVVPYGPRECPGLVYCDPWGARPRMLTLLITAVVVLGATGGGDRALGERQVAGESFRQMYVPE
jgi:hypothetical protein